MPSHARPTISKPLKPEDDWTRVKDPREKKRIQNRVAQRTYRHRMKARLGELQARLEQHEGPQASTRSGRPAHHETSVESLPQNFPSPPSNDMHRALPRLDTNLLYQPVKIEPQEWAAQVAAGQQFGGQSRSHSLPPNYGLLSPPSQSDCANAITPEAMSALNAHYADLSALPLLEDLSTMPQVSGAHSLAPTSTGTPSIASPQPHEAAMLADPSAQGAVSFFTAPLAQLPASSLVDPSHGFGPSPTCTDRSQMLDTASQVAANDCCAWDEGGFQDEVLKMTQSVIKAENSAARHDLIAKIAPLVDCCDENRLYSSHTLMQMKQTIEEDLPNSWAFANAMGADGGAAWQADRSNVALASVLLANFAGRIPNEKLLCLIGGCL